MEKKWTNIYLEKKNVDITGSCDLHIHSGPDCVERWGDTIDIARVAVEMGMRAIVFKDHFRPTTHKAILTNRAVPDIDCFSLHACNHPQGGINYRCVMMSVEEGVKVIQMPTMDSLHQHSKPKQGHLFTHFKFGQKVEPISIYNPGTKQLTDDLHKIIEAVIKNDLILSNGHLSPEETFNLFKAAKKKSKKVKLMVEHPNGNAAFTHDWVKKIAAQGALHNISYNACNPLFAGKHPREAAAMIKAVGPQHCTLITDGGNHTSPPPAIGMEVFANMMNFCGISKKDIDTMIKKNPAKILGLK